MSVATHVSPQLPFLRRYARALTGSQQSGDAYVAALLETLIADPTTFDTEADPRTESYRLLSKLWSSFSINTQADSAVSWEAAASRNLDAITPRARQAFVLISVEGFSVEKTAAILDSDESEVQALVQQAGREIGQQVKSKVLIIEDEPLIALDIETLVQELGHTVTGIARTHQEAVRLAFGNPPGIVLADIQLADGSSGVDAVNEILPSINVPVIFITAFPEKLLTGDKPEPAFLITKPFPPEMVKAVISLALFFDRKAGSKHAAE